MTERSYPAAIGQSRHWRLQAEQPGSAALNIGFALHFDGPLDGDAIEAALREVLDRQGVLRSAFAMRDGALWVDERPWPEWRLPVARGTAADRPAVDAVLSAEAARPFDLSEGVFRALLVRSPASPSSASLGLVFHHSVFDGWSCNVFFAELAALYGSYAAGIPAELPERPRPYADFVEWHRAALAEGAWDGQLDYWRERLRGVAAGRALPRDRDPGAAPYPVALASLALTPASSLLVEQIARRFRVLPYVVLLAAYTAQLAAHGGVDDVVVGCPFVGRRGGEWRSTVGLFVNTVPLRTDLAANPTLEQLVRETGASVRAGHVNQDLPLDRIVGEVLGAPASFSGLFDTLVQMQTAQGELPPFAGTSVELVPLWNVHTKYDLLVSFGRSARGLGGLFEYNARALDEATVQDFIAGYARVLDALCSRPELRVAELGPADGGPPLRFRPALTADAPTVGLRSVVAEVELSRSNQLV
jgi:hypothetical protein